MITTVGQMSSLQNFKYYLVLIVPGERELEFYLLN